MQVYRIFGAGFLEAIYGEALCIELDRIGLKFKNEEELKIILKRREPGL